MAYLLRSAVRPVRAAGSSARPFYCRAYSVTASHAAQPTLPQNPSSTTKPPKYGWPPELDGPVPEGVHLGKHRMKIDAAGYKSPLYTLIRDSCKCPLCVDQHSKQRSFRTTDIPANIAPRALKWVDGKLEIKWSNDIKGYDESHTSVYDPADLRAPWAIPKKSQAGLYRRRLLWNRPQMDDIQHWISFNDYVEDDAKFATAMRQLASTGLIFVKDIPESREMVEKIATRMGPLRNTFYGPTWDVRSVPQAKNVAYTNVFLGFHMDLMYMNEPPGFQLLHCLQNSCDGGESLFVDGFNVAKTMSQRYHKHYERLTNLWLNYEYNHKEHIYNNQWPVFETEGKNMLRINYSPPFQGALHQLHTDEQETKANFEALRVFAELLEKEENTFELKLNPGECAIFENRRVLHARRQFNTASGSRWLAGAYVDEDALMSRFKVCQKTQKDAWRNFSEETDREMKIRREAKEKKVESTAATTASAGTA